MYTLQQEQNIQVKWLLENNKTKEETYKSNIQKPTSLLGKTISLCLEAHWDLTKEYYCPLFTITPLLNGKIITFETEVLCETTLSNRSLAQIPQNILNIINYLEDLVNEYNLSVFKFLHPRSKMEFTHIGGIGRKTQYPCKSLPSSTGLFKNAIITITKINAMPLQNNYIKTGLSVVV